LTTQVTICFDARMPCIHVGPITIGPGHPLALISGPCVVEDPETMDRTADGLVKLCRKNGVPLIFKSSYEKDNRTAADAYRGPGLSDGLAELERLRERFGLPVTSDVHRVQDVEPAAQVLDLIQVPALLCRQTSLLEAVGRAGRPVNVKKGQFIAPHAMKGAVDKLGPAEVLLTERGSCFGHERLVCDLTSLPVLRSLGCPVCVDAGHASNRRSEIPLLARAAVAAGADALFVEVHPQPERARCDGPRMLSLSELEEILPGLVGLARAVREG
jgi:2-dehydro-3-deoxyphosphooctonate aldolase (KDO 8-P synthase)